MKSKILVLLILLLGISTVHAQSNMNEQNLNPYNFEKYIRSNKVQLLDVRTPAEFKESHIKDAININIFDENFTSIVKSKLNKSIPVAVYCRSGKRSAEASEILKSLGYKVKNLDGGIVGWEKSNLPITKD